MKDTTILRVAMLCLLAIVFCVEPAAANMGVQSLGVNFPCQIYALQFILLIMSSLVMRP